ncbi:MAG TPA: VOC family protein [Hyphomicrobiaceae bacterium]|jgi:PhnB protein|nr:VOC family protein [Hyphomicrobiaceae bacterium]
MNVNPYVNFNGQCEEAMKFYEKLMGGKIEAMMSFKGSPMESQVPAERRDKIMHARMKVGDTLLMASDAPPDRYEPPKGFMVTIQLKDPKEADRVFKGLSEKGNVQMPIQETFWAARFGMVTDRFGVPWMVNCDKPA